MKKTTLMAFLLALLAPMMSAWAGSTTWYAQLNVNKVTSSDATGSGKVYVGKDAPSASSTYNSVPTTSGKTKETGGENDTSHKFTFNLAAQADYKSKFDGWFKDEAANTLHSANASATYPITCTTENNETNPTTETVYAKFIPNPYEYTLTLNKPAGLKSYTITGPNGFPGAQYVNGGEPKVYNGEKYTITCTPDGYHLFQNKWNVDGTEKTGSSITLTISGNTSVTPVFVEKEKYTATCKPAAGGSYTAKTAFETKTISSSDASVVDYDTLSVTLTALEPNDGYEFYRWCITGSDGTTQYFSNTPYTTTAVKDNITINAEYISAEQTTEIDDYDGLVYALNNDSLIKVIIPSGKEITVAKGATLTVPSGKQLVVDGTLVVVGSVSNSGAVVCNGTLYKVSYLIDQGDSIKLYDVTGTNECKGAEFTDTRTKYNGKRPRYCDTKVEANVPNVSGVGNEVATKWAVLVDGITPYAISGQTIYGIKVNFDSSAALNKIASVTGSLTSNKIHDGDDNTVSSGNFILFSDCSLNGPTKKRGTSTTALAFNGIIDCAGKKLTQGINYTHSDFQGLFLNGNIEFTPGTDFQNANGVFVNCSSVKIQKIKGAPQFAFFGCGTKEKYATITFKYYSNSATATADGSRTAYFYNGYYNYTFNEISDKTTGKAKVYGGTFTSDPSEFGCVPDSYNDVPLKVKPIADDKFEVVEKSESDDDGKAVKIGESFYATLAAAFGEAKDGDVIQLQESVDISGETITTPKDMVLTLALEGHTISGGKIVNNSTLLLTDDTTGSAKTVTDMGAGTCKSSIENYGTLDIVLGTYEGNIVNKTGLFTTHNGLFKGAVTKEGGNVVAKGGHFASSANDKATVISFIEDDNVKLFNKESGWLSVCEVPDGTLSTATVQSLPGYSVTPYKTNNPDEYTLMRGWGKDSKHSRSQYTTDDWKRVAELLAFYQVVRDNILDTSIVFDRKVAGGSVTFKTNPNYEITPSSEMAAGSTNRLLTAAMTGSGFATTGFGYYRFFSDSATIKSVGFALQDNTGGNAGTMCLPMIEIWTAHGSKTNTVHVVGSTKYVIGAGSNLAMIRPETGAATFYATLGAAMNAAAADGGTVMLANDCTEGLALNKAGTYTFDTMGFAASDEVSVADGLFVKESKSADSSAKALVADAKATTYVVAQKVAGVGGQFYDNLTKAVAAANGAVVTLYAATEETITLTAEGQSFTLNKNGIAFDDAKVVTTIANGSVTKSVTDAGTVYTAVTSVVDASDGNKYTSVGAAVATVEGNDVSVTVTANVTEEVALPQGKALTVKAAEGVEANVTVTPADGAFVVSSAVDGGVKYESKKITVEMAESQAAVAVTKIDNGTESDVTDAAEINAAVTKMMGNNDVSRTDNTDKLDVLDKITVTPTKIVLAEDGSTVRSATFDVTPEFNAGQSLAEGQKLKFRLPVDAAATQLSAVVYHGTAQFGIFSVQTENDEKYIEVESDAFSPYGYELIDGETANPVAAIGTTGYATLAAAVAAVPDGTATTITMLADTAESVTIPGGKSVVLDLNGKTVSCANSTPTISVSANGSLAVADSSTGTSGGVQNTAANGVAIYCDAGSVTVNSGTVGSLDTHRGIVVDHVGTVVVNDGRVIASNAAIRSTLTAHDVITINGGTIGDPTTDYAVYDYDYATITIHGGVLNADKIAVTAYGSTLTIDGGEINKYGNTEYAILLGEAGTATISGGTITSAYTGIFMGDNGTTLNITGGTITAANQDGAISLNGTKKQTATINISGGTVANTGTGAAIYQPAGGTTVNVSGDAVLTGPTGIILKGGTLNISGGTITGNGPYTAPAAVGSGGTSTGDAVYVEDVYGPGDNNVNYAPTVNITGGTLTSVNGYAAQYFTEQTAPSTYKANGSIAISGNATLSSGKQTDAMASTVIPEKVLVSGGSFTHAVPEEYCADGYIPATQNPETGLYTVKVGSYVAQIGDVKYETFAEAIAAAEAYKTANDTYPVITVLDATAEQTNDGWIFSQDGQRLVRKVAMVTTNVDNYATTNYYASAAEAFSAAESAVANKSGTGSSYAYVTLLADDTLPGDATTVLKSNHGSTDRRYIDLNGHTLTAPKGISLEYKSGGFQVYLQDGSAGQTGRVVNPTADDSEAFVFMVGSSVSLAVEGGAIVAKGTGTALKTTGGGSISLKGGSVTADPAGRALSAAGTNNITAPADSTVSVTGTLGAPTGKLILQGGTFAANAANGELFDVGETGSVAVSGGSYSIRVADEYIATGYKDAGQTAVVENYYTVTKEVYTIRFVDENDAEIVTLQIPYNDLYKNHTGDGKIPAIPVKASDDPAFYYTGAWSPSATTSTRATGNATHKLTYTLGKYNFQYGDGLYTNTFANAYKNVADGGTITVCTDAFALTSTTLNNGKSVTVDLNGSTLSMNNTGMLTVSGEGTKVTFANGTIKHGSGTTARDALVKVTSPAEVAFEDVELQGASYYTTAVSVASGASAAFSGDCVVTMPSGKQAVTAADGGTVAISGGLYSTEVPAEYCAADYKPATDTVAYNDMGYYTVSPKGVAKIGDVYYDTFAEAIAAAQAGDTVTLLADVDLGTTGLVIAEGKNFTLDIGEYDITGTVNGKLITNNGTVTIEGTTGCIYNKDISAQGHDAFLNNGTATINGGWFGDSDNDKTNANAINRGGAFRNLGTATINGGHFTACDNFTNGGYAYAIINGNGSNNPTLTINNADVYGKNNGNIANNSGTVDVKGGSFSLNGTNNYYGIYAESGSTVTVSGGEFAKTGSSNGLFYSNGDVDISGGTFTAGNGKLVQNANAGIEISGGSFSVSVPEQYCADGYIPAAQDSETGMYTVKTGSYVAQIGSTKYESLAEAVAAASAGATVELIADDRVSLTHSGAEVVISKPITITGAVDGNGAPLYTVYGWTSAVAGNYNDIFVASSSGTVTISNLAFAEFGNEAANTVSSYSTPIFVSANNNNVVLENLVISDFNRTAIKINGGEFLVKDCYIDCATTMANYRIGGIDVANDATGSIVGTTIANVDTSDPTKWVSAGLELIGSGAIRVEDCSITSSMYGIFVSTADGTSPGSSAVTVVNTTVDADMYALINDSDSDDAEIAVESGSYTGMLYAGTETGLAISGGMFDDEIPEEYCADGYIPTDADPNTGLYTVKQGAYVAQNTTTDTKYETLADAFADASEGDTVLLLTDVTEALAYGEDMSVTLNLNGNTISVSSGYAISVTVGELTVTSVVDDDGYATGGIVGAISVSDGASLNLRGGIYDVDWDECDIEGSISVSSVNRFYDIDPTEVEAASAVFTSPVPYEYCSTGFIPGAYDDIYIDGEFYYYVKEGTYLWKITDADGKVAYSEEVPYADDDEEWWEYDWFGEHEMNRNGFTMTLLHDVSADDDNFSAYVSGLTYTVDLGGHTVNQQMGFGVGECDVTIVNGTVSNAGGTAISIANGAQVTLGDGLVIAQSTTGVYVEGGTEEGACSKLTVKNGAAINGTYGVLVFGSGSSNPVTEVVVEGGTITGTTYGISGNGTIEGDTDNSNTRIAILGGTVSGGEVGIYHPQAGELSVSGGTISGKMAIYARSGTIAVTGGSLNATGTSGEYNVSYAGNELQQTGDALVLDAVDYPGGNPTATISGGTFVSVNGDGVASYAATGQSAESGFVSGGTFSSEVPEEYCADGYIPTDADPNTGLYTVKQGAYVAQIVRAGEVIAKYETLAAAIADALTGDTVQLLADVTENVTVNKAITIDGQTYTLTGDGNSTVLTVDGGVTVEVKNIVIDGAALFNYLDGTVKVTGYSTLALGEGVSIKNGIYCNLYLDRGSVTGSQGVTMVGGDAVVNDEGKAIYGDKDITAAVQALSSMLNGGSSLEPGTTIGLPYFDIVRQRPDGDIVNIADGEGRVKQGASLLFLANGDFSDAGQGTVTLPTRFYSYTLNIANVVGATGWTEGEWNDIIDTGCDTIDLIAGTGQGDKPMSETVDVTLKLNEDVAIPGEDGFEYRNSNFTIDGNDHAISGTIVYTDNAGTMENVVMGTEQAPLVLDMTGLSAGNSINLGSGIAATNVTIKVTETQAATQGTTIVTWNAGEDGEEEAASLAAGVKVAIVDATTGEPVKDEQGEDKTASLMWDAERGVGYIGPCEARLTTVDANSETVYIYTSLAHAIELARNSGDTVTLMMDIADFTGTQDIAKSLTLDGAGHTITAGASADGDEMFNVTGDVDVTITDITLDGAHRYTYCIQAYGSDVNLTLNDVTILHGTKEWFAGFKYGAGVHVNGANLVVGGSFTAFSGGKTDESFPFTGILYSGGTIRFEDGATASIANPEDATDTDLLLVGMLGAMDVSDPADKAEVEATLAGMNIPAGYYPYTLKINPDEWGYSFDENTSFTGASPLGWNAIIDYGKAIMTAVSMDTAETPVEVGLLADTELPDTLFTYEDSNFTVNGNGNALSGTIKYTDDAGIIKNIVLGTEEKPLILDLREVTEPVEIGNLIGVTNVTVLMTAEQATLGQPVFMWNVETAGEPDNAESVKITVLESAEVPYNPEEEAVEKGLVWDDELGIAYIGPCEARLTGPEREPGYMDLTNAFNMAVGGDTVTLFWSGVTLNEEIGLPAGTLLFATNKYELALGENAAIVFTNATTVFRTELDAIDFIALAGDCATGYWLRHETDGITNVYSVVERGEYVVSGDLADGTVGTATIKASDAWIAANVGANVKTINEIENFFNSTNSAIGMREWEKYVLNQTAGFIVTAVAASDNAVSTTLVEPASAAATGFTVAYSLDRVAPDFSVVAAGETVASRSFTVPVDAVTASAIYRVRVHLTSGGDETETTFVVDSANAIGVMKVSPPIARSIIAVPWRAFGGGDISVADYIRSGLAEGDALHAYNGSSYDTWTYENGGWTATRTFLANESGTSESTFDGTAAEYGLKSGSGVWLERAGEEPGTVCMIGEYSPEAVVTALAAGESARSPSWTLVAPPMFGDSDLNELFPDASSADRIVVPLAALQRNYTCKNGKWGYSDARQIEVNGRIRVQTFHNTENATIPMGTGFWYLNGGAAKTIEW